MGTQSLTESRCRSPTFNFLESAHHVRRRQDCPLIPRQQDAVAEDSAETGCHHPVQGHPDLRTETTLTQLPSSLVLVPPLLESLALVLELAPSSAPSSSVTPGTPPSSSSSSLTPSWGSLSLRPWGCSVS